MPRLYLVRHGLAAAGWDADADPGLSEIGHAQARAAADTLAQMKPAALVTSPMRRCRETAAPLAAAWKTQAAIDPRVSEIASPTDDLAERGAWLRDLMAGTWDSAGDAVRAWAGDVVAALTEAHHDQVVFTHFVAINVAVGAALADPRCIVFRPDNASVTVLETDGRALTLVERGRQAQTHVG